MIVAAQGEPQAADRPRTTFYTRNAFDRMQEWSISRPDVERVLNQEAASRHMPSGASIYSGTTGDGRRLSIAVEEDEQAPATRTVLSL